MDQLPKPYDFVLIDCPPNVGLLTFNALRAAEEVIIPLETSYYALHGVGKLLETIGLLEDRVGHQLSVRILPTLFDGRTRFAKRALAEIRETYKDLVFDTVIRQNVRLREAAQRGIPIAKLDKRCYGFVDYMSLALELLFDRVEQFEDAAHGVEGNAVKEALARGIRENGAAAAPAGVADVDLDGIRQVVESAVTQAMTRFEVVGAAAGSVNEDEEAEELLENLGGALVLEEEDE